MVFDVNKVSRKGARYLQTIVFRIVNIYLYLPGINLVYKQCKIGMLTVLSRHALHDDEVFFLHFSSFFFSFSLLLKAYL